MKKPLLWALSFLITLFFALFQRMTGPTYPVKGHASPGPDEQVSYRLPRSCTIAGADCVIKIRSAAPLQGFLLWKRYKTSDAPVKLGLDYKDGLLSGALPDQPPAGKLEYRVFLKTAGGDLELSKTPVVTRFKGAVPVFVLIPHIALMFLFMLFSVRIFLSAAFGLEPVKHSIPANVAFLVVGGFIFGPLMQYFAFGQAWTGFPFGYDLTDNKTLIMLVFWLIALWANVKGRAVRFWVIAAFVVTAAVYFVPHSMFGSELDYQKGAVVTGK